MKLSRALALIAFATAVGAIPSLHAQTTLLAWDFFGNNTATATATAGTKNGNLDSSSTLSRGAGAAASAANNSFRTAGFQNNGISTANTDYFQFSISATTGYTLSLSSITANFAGTASFATSPGVTMQYAYSTDGTNFTLIGSTFNVVGTPGSATVDLTGVTALQSLAASSDITLRFYASGQTATGGWGFTSAASGTNGLAVNGTLTALPSPSLTWSGGNGTWDTSSLNFTSGAAAWSNTTNASDKAIFPTASQSITVATGITAGSIQFDASGIALSGGSLVNGNATTALTALVTNSSDTATISTALSDGGKGFTKDGAGILALSGTQTGLTGGITVTNGTLQTDAGIISGKNVTNNGTLELTAGSYASGTMTNAGTLLKSGSATVTLGTTSSGSGATTVTGGTLTTGANQAISTGALTVNSATLDLSTRDATVASIALTGGTIANAGTLTLGASGTLTTTGNATTASISGTTLALGATAHTFNIADGAAASDLTISAGLTGNATLTKSGAGTLTLSGANSGFSGTISHGNGTITAATATALGTGQLNFNGGTLSGNGSALTLSGNSYQLQGGGGTLAGTGDLTLAGNWTNSTAASLTLTVTNTGITTLGGTFVSNGTTKTLTTNVATNLTMSGVISSGAGFGLVKTGNGTLTLSGANTYTGNTTISGGTLKLGASNVIADAVSVIINSITAGVTSTFDLDGNSDTISSLTFGGATGTATSTSNVALGAGTLTLGGDVTYDATNNPLGSTISGAGNLALGANRTFTLGDSSNAISDLTVSANITGSGFILTKAGAGTLALSGSNTYSGGTTVNAGTIAATSSNAFGMGVTTINSGGTVTLGAGLNVGSNFTVNSGGTLNGLGAGSSLGGIVNGAGGTLAGTLTIASGGSVAPGSSPGLLNVTGNVTFASNSTYTWELGAFSTTTPGTNFDQLTVATGGVLNLLAGAKLVPSFTGSATSPATGNGFWSINQTWTVATNTGGTITGTAFTVDNTGWTNGSFATSLSNNEVLLTWTASAIPEPSTYAAIVGALALGGAIWRRRKSQIG